MAKSKQTKPTAKGRATSSARGARGTQASSPSSEDGPLQESRRPRTSPAAKGNLNNQTTQQNDDSQDDQSGDEPWMPDVRADARALTTVAGPEKEIENLREIVQGYAAKRLLTDMEKIGFATATYELKILKQRRDELKAALRKQSSAASNPSYTGKGKAAGPAVTGSEGQVDSEDEEISEDELQQPPRRRSPRNRNVRKAAQSSKTAPTKQRPASRNPEGYPRSVNNENTTNQKWKHEPMKYWKIRGIVKDSKSHYKVAWKGSTKDENGHRVDWDDFWVHKSYVNDKAKEDWNRRKGTKDRWRDFDDSE